MKPQSAKAKGRVFQQFVRDMLLGMFTSLSKDDVRSTSMGAGGEDIQLSAAARKLIPFQIECKSRDRMSVFKDYAQAQEHGPHEPVLVIKQNHSKALAVVDAELFFHLVKENNNKNDHSN
jgi:hypothetical protein